MTSCWICALIRALTAVNGIMINKKALTPLRNASLTFHIEPVVSDSGLVTLDEMLRVLSGIKNSYQAFLGINLKNSLGPSLNDEELPVLAELLIVDVKVASYEIKAAPKIIVDDQQVLLEELDLKTRVDNAYQQYYTDVLTVDFSNTEKRKNFLNTYNSQERKSILTPLFNSLGTEYTVTVQSEKSSLPHFVRRPQQKIRRELIPRNKIEKPKRTAYVLAEIDDSETLVAKKSSIKKVLSLQLFTLENIVCNDRLILLHRSLPVKAKRKKDNFVLTNEELGITVWGKDVEEAKLAFNFAFDSLYREYYLEEDANLSEGALKLKTLLRSIIRKVVQ